MPMAFTHTFTWLGSVWAQEISGFYRNLDFLLKKTLQNWLTAEYLIAGMWKFCDAIHGQVCEPHPSRVAEFFVCIFLTQLL